MKNKLFISAVFITLLSMSVFAQTGINKANTAKVTYNLLSGGTFTNQAEGKPKILLQRI